MKARHICAGLGVTLAVASLVFLRSFTYSNARQGEALAERMLAELPVETGAKVARLLPDYRPDGIPMQGRPLMALVATRSSEPIPEDGIVIARALFAQRHLDPPAIGTELPFAGQGGSYNLKIVGIVDWAKPSRGYPNAFVSPATAAKMQEAWTPWRPQTAAELAPGLAVDEGKNISRAKPLLLWAAVLTAFCLLMNSIFLSLEAKRRDFAILRVLGLTRGGVVWAALKEAFVLALAGSVTGAALGALGAVLYVNADRALFPAGAFVDFRICLASIVAAPLLAGLAVLLALRTALGVKPLEAASNRYPRKRHLGALISFAIGFGAFVAVEVWGGSLMRSFVPSPEWPDAIVSILPGGVSSFEIEKLRALPGVRRLHELQPLQVDFAGHPEVAEALMPPRAGKDRPPEVAEALMPPRAGKGRPPEVAEALMPPRAGKDRPPERGGKSASATSAPPPGFRGKPNALLLASDYLPPFRFIAGDHDSAAAAIASGDNCVITEMMARARKLKLGDDIRLDCGRGLVVSLKIVGIVDLNWHLVTSRGLVRGLNRKPVMTDGPLFVSFDTLDACDMRPAAMVGMTHLWLDYEPDFLAEHGVFEAGRRVEEEICAALSGPEGILKPGTAQGNNVQLHQRDEVADGTLAHGDEVIGAMARIPFIFLAVISLGFIALLVASVEARKREFAVLRTIGATRGRLAAILTGEALGVALKGMLFGFVFGGLAGWLFTHVTRASMANWGLPPSFAVPWESVAKGAVGALVFVLVVAVPTALALIRRATRR